MVPPKEYAVGTVVILDFFSVFNLWNNLVQKWTKFPGDEISGGENSGNETNITTTFASSLPV